MPRIGSTYATIRDNTTCWVVMDSALHNASRGCPDSYTSLSMQLLYDLQLLHWTTYLYSLLCLLLTALLYYVQFKPINWTRDLSEVGYRYLTDSPQYQIGNKTKREQVQDVRRRRQVGDIPPVYPNGWFVLLESTDIKPGEVKHVGALGENFAVFRSKEGQVFVLDAYCPHLGANMAIGGVVKGDCLECPFHAWQFSGEDGTCSHIPYTDKVPKSARVKKWTSYEVNDLVFVWYHAEGLDPTWQIQPIQQIQSQTSWYRGRMEHYVTAHIEDISENVADAAHLNTVHKPAEVGGSDLRLYHGNWHSFVQNIWCNVNWKPHTKPGEEHIATGTLDHHVEVFNWFKLSSVKATVTKLGPGYFHIQTEFSSGTIDIILTMTPVEPLLQRFVQRFYCPPRLMLLGYLVFASYSVQMERDIMVWNHKKCVKPVLVKEEQALVQHKRWFSQFYTEHSPKFTFHQDTLEW